MTRNMSLSAGIVVCAGIYLLQMVAGQLQEPPQNVTFYTKNFNVFVKWLPGTGYPADVRYTVDYRQVPSPLWKPLHDCQHISNRECNVTCADDAYSKVETRVKASVATQESPWKESETYFQYYSDVELGPPQLHVNVLETYMTINAFVHPPTCILGTILDLKYEWTLWEVGKEVKIEQIHLIHEAVNISIAGLRGNYCMIARTTVHRLEEKHSPFSEPLCLQLNQKSTDLNLLLVVPLILFVAVVVICLIMKFKTHPTAKLPASLDFSLGKQPLQPYICDPKDLLLKMSQIRTSDPPSQRIEDRYYASLDSHEETSSSCRGYSEKHQFPNLGVPIEDPNETKQYPYKKLPSSRSEDSESSDSVQSLGPSGSLFVESTNQEGSYDVESKENSSPELCDERVLTPDGLEIEERSLVVASSKQGALPYFCQIPLSAVLVPGGLGVTTLSESNLTLVAKGDIWTNKQYNATNHSQQDICPRLQTPYQISSPQIEEDQSMCFQVTMDSDNLSNYSEDGDWDDLLLKAECADQSELFSGPIDTCMRESSSCDNIQAPGCQSAYLSR